MADSKKYKPGDLLDVKIENGKVVAFRAKVSLSFKYEGAS